MTFAHARSVTAGAVPVVAPRTVFRRRPVELVRSWAAAVRAAMAPDEGRRRPPYPALRTEFMEDAAMKREMHRL
ncbi:hypothetical protein FHT40_003718 [Mycolicibacterium sp. BK556]|uniref:hypothetical protein n=1 Tax=Mycobacteriaceae TaxID=1762 RepID=UPI00105D71D7|nr:MULTISPECIES: hypothetical protein [Mycobacteriaceae]MBB3604057.1 hypothetical protein [Mycolicibacterium sp. BK556]MBB3634253.1 hypothetical protein [Mycolicibacterium sp. BK607]MBB3751833.1 hypothetical protein [Mycolicibacterium sp. BK634]